jgi:hypothetical protein
LLLLAILTSAVCTLGAQGGSGRRPFAHSGIGGIGRRDPGWQPTSRRMSRVGAGPTDGPGPGYFSVSVPTMPSAAWSSMVHQMMYTPARSPWTLKTAACPFGTMSLVASGLYRTRPIASV